MEAQSGSIRWSRDRGVVSVTLDAAGGNLVTLSMLENLRVELERLHRDADVRALHLGATGDDFSRGMHLGDPNLAAMVLGGDGSRRKLARIGRLVVDALASFPVPTVVSARGRILGAGACLFTACDFRFASPDATLGFPEVDRAMHLSWGIIPRVVAAYGQTAAKRLTLLGDAVDVATLVPAVEPTADPDSAARALTERLAAKPPLALRAITRVLRTNDTTDDEALFASTAASADFAEAMSAFMAKRAAVFSGR